MIFHQPVFGNDTLYFDNANAQKAAFDKYGHAIYSNPEMTAEYGSSPDNAAQEEYERMVRGLEFVQEARRKEAERRTAVGYRPWNFTVR